METLPEPRDPIKTLLSALMSDQDVARYSDLAHAIEMVKRGRLRWQAPVSIGVHAFVLGALHQADGTKGPAESLVGYALEPLEALHESLKLQRRDQPLTQQQARMLFHVRFALGFLFLAKGERQRGIWLLQEMASTPLTWSAGQVRAGPGLVTWRTDLAVCKILVAQAMPFIDLEELEYDSMPHTSALQIVKHAADCVGGGAGLISLACDLLDRAAATCDAREWTELEQGEREPGESYDDAAFEAWQELLGRAVDLLAVCQRADTSGSLPRDCDKDSAQFLAYKVGQLAAAFSMSKADVWERFVADEEFGPYGARDFLLDSLMCEYEQRRDWHRARGRYVERWKATASCEGASPDQIGPHIDLYWAMRIGFADKMIESTQALEPVQPPAAEVSVVQDVHAIRDIVSSIALRQLKQEQELEQRLPPRGRQLHRLLSQCMGDVWPCLPSKVVDALTKAESYYTTQVNDDDAKVWFVKAVEAALDDCFLSPLADFMRRDSCKQIDLPLPTPRDRMAAKALRRLALSAWADVFDGLAPPPRKRVSALRAGEGGLSRFLDEHIGPRWPDFRPLAQSLRNVQEFRGGSAHYQLAETRVDKESWELEEMRKLVLGIGSPSVIAHIYHLLASSKQS